MRLEHLTVTADKTVKIDDAVILGARNVKGKGAHHLPSSEEETTAAALPAAKRGEERLREDREAPLPRRATELAGTEARRISGVAALISYNQVLANFCLSSSWAYLFL